MNQADVMAEQALEAVRRDERLNVANYLRDQASTLYIGTEAKTLLIQLADLIGRGKHTPTATPAPHQAT